MHLDVVLLDKAYGHSHMLVWNMMGWNVTARKSWDTKIRKYAG